MIDVGKVVSVDGDKAKVQFKRRGECDRCRICLPSKDGFCSELYVPNTLDVGKDDYVRVEVYKKKVRVQSVLLYLLPLVLTAFGAGIGTLMSVGASVILAIAGLIVGLAFAVPIDVCVVRKKSGFKPQMIAVCTEADYMLAEKAIIEKAYADSRKPERKGKKQK